MTYAKPFGLIIFAALLLIGLNAHASGTSRVFFSGYFSAHLSTPSLEGATFFVSDGPGVKFANGSYLAGSLITREGENFDYSFQLRDYPLYLFGLKDTGQLTTDQAEKFQRSHEALKHSLGSPVFEATRIPGATLYSACSDRCEAIVVQDTQDEHLLHITSRGLSQNDLMTLLQDSNHADD